MTVRASCQVCGKGLRNSRSVELGVGPICARRVRAIIEGIMQASGQIATTVLEQTQSYFRTAVERAQEAYRTRIRRRRQQEVSGQVINEPSVPDDRTVPNVWSESRNRNEEIRIEFSDTQHGIAHSSSGNSYNVTSSTCSCPHFRYRLQNTGETCRHIEAFVAAQRSTGASQEPLVNENRTDSLAVEITESLHEQNRRQFFQIDWTDEQEREQVLDIWRANRGFDGVYMSQDDQAWSNLYDQAGQNWEYRYDNVLGGTGNSFGIELEFEMPAHVSGQQVARALYDADILDRPSTFGYHAGAGQVGPGYWRLERDGSLVNGLELVSPVLYDKPETWQQIEKATRILNELGVKTSVRTGGHIHVGIAPLDHRTYSWQRLARIGIAYERVFYRMGGADAEQYDRTGIPGVHRGTDYVKPLGYEARFIRGTDTAVEARTRLSRSRYSLFNATNVDASYGRKPTVEMRYPNGTLDHRQIQAQVMVANAVVHQAAVIRNDSPQSRFTPGLSQVGQQYRLSDPTDPQREEKSFRAFLDVLGNQEDRLAAAWLYRRGSVN